MKLKKIVSMEILSRMNFCTPVDFYKRLMLHHDMLGALKPTKWGWWEPASHPWDVSDLNTFIPDDRGGDADSVYWVHNKKPKAEGDFGVAPWSPHEKKFTAHATEWLHCELEGCPVADLVAYIQRSAVAFDCDIALIHHVAESEQPIRAQETEIEGCFNVRSLRLRGVMEHWLPALPWGVVFGDAYVRMFGMERLLSAPAYKVEKLSDTAVYLQLSEKLTDLETHYDAVHAVRQQVQAHLGHEAFFDEARAYHLRCPSGSMSGPDFVKAWQAFKRPEPGTNGFKVPEFRLIED